jgi:hypothetical protein
VSRHSMGYLEQWPDAELSPEFGGGIGRRNLKLPKGSLGYTHEPYDCRSGSVSGSRMKVST